MKRHSMMTVATCCCLALLALSCSQQQQPAPDTRAVDEAAIRQADIAWSGLADAKQLDAFNGYFLGDAIVLGPNEPMAIGKEAIRKVTAGIFETPGFSLKWQPTKVEAARFGDLGYSVGTYEMSMNDPKGAPMVDRGKYATVWKKQADGNWKVAIDMFNSDLPVPSPSQ